MTSRREVALGGLLTILMGSSEAPCQSLGVSSRPHGCMIPESFAKVLMAKSSGHQLFATGNEPVVQSSGNRKFDFALAQTLSRITATLEVLPGFAYFDDSDSKNAFATDAKRLARADGTVLFGLRLLRETLVELDNPDIAVTAVCAHEYGHILQFKYGLHATLMAGQETVKRVELHADFLSGFYAGMRKLQKPDYPAAVFAKKSHSLGDRNVNEPNHHGTPEERAAAIVRGFEVAYRERRPLMDAIRTGVQYVSTL